MSRLYLFIPALALCSCSLVKLSDDITQGHCSEDMDCAELNNEKDPEFDPCQRWQCNTESKLCEYGALDADNDGQTPGTVEFKGKEVECEDNPRRQDCDDDDDEVNAGLEEACDDKDNDCDGLADEDALNTQRTRVVVMGGDRTASDAAYAQDTATGSVGVAYSVLEGANAPPGASLVDPSFSDSANATALIVQSVQTPQIEQVAITALDADRFAYALINTSGTRRLIAGVWQTSANQIGVESGLASAGISCFAGESCDDVREPALAASGRNVLLGYSRWAGDVGKVACGTLRSTDDPAQLVATLLTLTRSSSELTEVKTTDPGTMTQIAEPIAIGESSDLSPPAIIALPPIGEISGGFLVGYANTEGRVQIDYLERDGTKLVVKQAELVTFGAKDEDRSTIAIALGPEDDDGRIIAIASQYDCNADARTVIDFARLRDDDGELASEILANSLIAGDDPNQAAPSITYNAGRDQWLATYRSPAGLRARVLTTDGTLYGKKPYALIDRVKASDGDEVQVLPLPTATYPTGKGFTAVAHVLRDGEEDKRAFEAVTLSCGG